MSDATTKSAAPNAYSVAEWEALGPMGRVADAAGVIFDRDETDQVYAGNDERVQAERPYIPHVFVTSARHALANPRRASDMIDYEAAHALHAHYSRTLAKGDQKAVNLLVELARTANKLITDGIERKGRSDAELRTEILDTRTARGDKAKDLAEEAASVTGRNAAPGARDFAVIAQSTDEAKVIRAMMDYALKVMPPDSELESQKLIHRPEELPAWAEMKKALDKARPDMWGFVREDGKRAIALIVSEGLEDAAAKWVAEKIGPNFTITPGYSRYIETDGGRRQNALWGALMTHDGNQHWRNQVKRPDGLKGAAAIYAFNENAINDADRTVVFWNKDVMDQAFIATAYAARRGKLEMILDFDGKAYDAKTFHSLAEEAMDTHLSKAEFARMRNVGVHDIAANTPEGRLALSLIRSSSAAMPAIAIEALAKTGLTINDIVGMASDPKGREELFKTHKISAPIMDALADQKVMSNARDAFQRILAHCKDHGVTIVGPEHYPVNLRRSKANLPPVLFLKGGSPEMLRDAKNTVVVMGDHDMLAPMANKASQLMVSLDRPDITLVQVERQGAPEYVPNNGGIVFLPCGHGHYGARTKLDWGQDFDNGELVRMFSDAKSGRYELIPSKDGSEMALHYTPKDGEKVELAKVKTPERPVVTPFDKVEDLDEATQNKMRAYNNAINGLFDRAGTHETFRLSKPVRDFREGIVSQGGMLVSRYAPIESNSVYSFATGQREGNETFRSQATEAATIELAARACDTVVLNQISADSPMCGAVAVLAETGRRPGVIQPDPNIVNLDEISGNLALARVTGKELPMHISLPGQRGMAVEKAFGGQRVGISTGPNMELAAEKIAEQLTTPTVDRVFGTKKTAVAAR